MLKVLWVKEEVQFCIISMTIKEYVRLPNNVTQGNMSGDKLEARNKVLNLYLKRQVNTSPIRAEVSVFSRFEKLTM